MENINGDLGLSNYLNLISKDINKMWSRFELPQKLAIVALIIVTAVAVTYFIAKSTEPDWSILYTDLNETDAVAVVENLKDAGYPYKIGDKGRTILVPAKQKEDLRLLIAENDVIKDSNPGFELLDKMQLGATDFQNKLTRQRIFQGELTRTIERIKGVQKVRIQIAEPERSVFSDRDEPPSASVMLILIPGYKMKQQQVKAIKNLVAYSIPRLKPEKVFVTDQNGVALNDELGKNSSDIESFSHNLEERTASKVKKVLERIVGYDNVSVEVNAEINFDSAKSTIERYIPIGENKGILASSQSESETYGKGEATQQAIKGFDDRSSGSDKKNMSYKKSKTFTNYNVTKEVKQVIYAPGSIERLTVAVAINKVLTTTEKNELKDLVISASGADVSRGDIITITSMQFAAIEEDKLKSVAILDEYKKESRMDLIVSKVAPLVVILIIGLSALFVLNSLLRKPIEGFEVYDGQDESYGLGYSNDEDPLSSVDLPVLESKLEPELEQMKTEISGMVQSNSEEAARLLLAYIKE